MSDKTNWKKDYDAGKTLDCPCCGQDSPEHSCRECRSEISKDVCWGYGGYCQKCFDLIHNEIPKIHELKEKLGLTCKCDNALCGKCLGGGCKDVNCPTHTKALKADWMKRNKNV